MPRGTPRGVEVSHRTSQAPPFRGQLAKAGALVPSKAMFLPPPSRDPELLVGLHSPPSLPERPSAGHHSRPGQGCLCGGVQASSSSWAPAASTLFPPPLPSVHPSPAAPDTCPVLAGSLPQALSFPCWEEVCIWPISQSPASRPVCHLPLCHPRPQDLAEGWVHQEGMGSRVTPTGEGPLEDPGERHHKLVPPHPLARDVRSQFKKNKRRSPRTGHHCAHFKGPDTSPRILVGVGALNSCLALNQGIVAGVEASGVPVSHRLLSYVGCGFVAVCSACVFVGVPASRGGLLFGTTGPRASPGGGQLLGRTRTGRSVWRRPERSHRAPNADVKGFLSTPVLACVPLLSL